MVSDTFAAEGMEAGGKRSEMEPERIQEVQRELPSSQLVTGREDDLKTKDVK